MPRVLLLLPAAGYRNEDFLAAAGRLGIEVTAAANHCRRLAPLMGMSRILALPFDQPQVAARQALESLGRRVDAVLAVDDHGVELASVLAEKLGLAANSPQSVRTTRDKLEFRRLLQQNGFNCPQFREVAPREAPRIAPGLRYPVVVKARRLSASQGVIRADDPDAFVTAVARVHRIQRAADREARSLTLIAEEFIPGAEYALEGLLENGRLRVLALFDKPDPLDGPYFEETLYVTPSRLAPARQSALAAEVERACSLIGLVSGPVHAEARTNERGVWLLEIAARSIGGLCARVLHHRLGMPLEELILRHALGMPIGSPPNDEAAGVMMIPVPSAGIFESASGVDSARQCPGITDVRITANPGEMIAPPPEGCSYLGFIFSRAGTAHAAEAALRSANARLSFHIQPQVRLVRVGARQI